MPFIPCVTITNAITAGLTAIAREHGLNARQALAVEALLERGQLGIEEFEDLVPGVHRRTLQRDLQGLVERGVAVSRGAARAVRYHLHNERL